MTAQNPTESQVDTAAVKRVAAELRYMAYRPFGPDDFPKLEELADQLDVALGASPSEGGVGPR